MILDWIKEKIVWIIFSILIIISICLSIFSIYYTYDSNKKEDTLAKELVVTNSEEEEFTEPVVEEKAHVDIKGAVKNPGVYECSNCLVKDVIDLAGGLLKTASTENINLSKKIYDEMVIIVNTKSEIKTLKEEKTSSNVNNYNINTSSLTNNELVSNGASISEDRANNDTKQSEVVSENNTKVNINTADINTLTTISGIGESKAKSIIEYRNTSGNFNKIEDIMNVTGIGESLFEKIKNSITV